MIRTETRALLDLLRQDRVTMTFGTLLIILNVAVVVTYVLAKLAEDQVSFAASLAFQLNLGRDGSMAEHLGHGASFLASALFLLAYLEFRSANLLSLSALMAFIWIDDSGQYHERFGGALVEALDLAAIPGLRPQDSGEILAWLLAAAFLTVLFFLSIRRRHPGDAGILASVAVAFGLLVLFGAGVDMVHILVPDMIGGIEVGGMIGTIEDGGELISVALIAICAVGVVRNGRAYYEQCARQSTAPSQSRSAARNPHTAR